MLYSQTVPVFTQQAKALLGQIAKAKSWCAEQGIEDGELLDTQLAPDMFPLAKQLDFVVAQMLQPMRRLSGQDLPDPPEADASLDGYAARISAAVTMLAALDAESIDAKSDTMVALDLPNGMAFDLSGVDYVRDWALPQFWFHIMTAYALIRARGVPVGKADFVPHMLRHLRKA